MRGSRLWARKEFYLPSALICVAKTGTKSICNALNNWQIVSYIICEFISPKRTVKSLWTSAEVMKGRWGGVGRAWTRWLVCLQDYKRTSSCERFKFTWGLHHTFRYNMHKVALFSPHFSDQACRNILAAMPVWHLQHYGVNQVSSSTYCSCKPVSKPHTAQVNFCLLSRLESTQVTFSYLYTLNIGAAQQITQQRPALTYILPA